jgi:S1-C subfamily serine protease
MLRSFLSALLLISSAVVLQAQQAAVAPSPEKKPTPCSGQNTAQAPTTKPSSSKTPVYPVVRRLSGFEVLALLRSAGAEITSVDSRFLFDFESHVNIVAGFTIGDGKTIITRLPQLEITQSYSVAYAPQNQPQTPKAKSQNQTITVTIDPTPVPSAPNQPNVAAPSPVQNPRTKVTPSKPAIVPQFTMSPMFQPYGNIAVFVENGCQLSAKFVGLDGKTGLSLLQVEGLNQTSLAEADVSKLTLAQPVLLFAPRPLEQQLFTTKTNTLFLKVDSLQGTLKSFEKNQAGEIQRMIIAAQNISPELVGGVVENQNGETIGVIENITATEARVIPITDIKQAIDRVRLQATRKPQPWLGVRGEAINTTSINRLMSVGWTQTRAIELLSQNRGLLLTSVPTGTPAALSQLKAGDVIWRINEKEIKTADEFTALLNSVGSNKEVAFEVLSPSSDTVQTVNVRLGETPNPFSAMRLAESYSRALRTNDLLLKLGMETAQFKQSGQFNKPSYHQGRVVYEIYPESFAERAGLKVGDIIETINGQNVNMVRTKTSMRGEITLTVIRNNEKLIFKINPNEEVKK